MRLRLGFWLLGALCVLALAACGGSSDPQILVFKGPGSVSCTKQGQVKTVAFVYKTKNAEAVEPEVDHNAIGAQAGYPPNGGTMRFPYQCDGPHTLTITASKGSKSVSKSVTVVPSSGG